MHTTKTLSYGGHIFPSGWKLPPTTVGPVVFQSLGSRVLASLFVLLATGPALADPPHAHVPGRPKQVVIISFDSARDIAQWQRSRDLAR